MDMRAERDYDHVVALFRRGGCWGAISKTNPPVLRWRDPVYRTLRELAMSVSARVREQGWAKNPARLFTSLRPAQARAGAVGHQREECWNVGETIDAMHHYPLVTKSRRGGCVGATPWSARRRPCSSTGAPGRDGRSIQAISAPFARSL